MRVLHVINTLGTGGAEKLLVDSIPIYHSKGIPADVLVLRGTASPLLDQLRNQSHCRVMISGFGTVYNPRHILKIRSLLPRYDIVHVHLFPSLYWASVAKRLCKAPTRLLFTEHSTSNKRREKVLHQYIDRMMYGCYDKIVTIAAEVDRKLKAHLGFGRQKFSLIPNGIDTKLFADASPYPRTDFFGETDKIIIQVSGFRPPKDQPTLIRALVHLPENVKLLLVGDGPQREACEALAEKLSLSSRIKFLGVRMDVPQLLKTSDVVVLSSQYEGLSLASLEAMASGRPFVASDVPGLADLVRNAGLLFPAGDSNALAGHISRLLSDSQFSSEVVAKCRAKAAHYDIRKMVDSYVKVYKEMIRR